MRGCPPADYPPGCHSRRPWGGALPPEGLRNAETTVETVESAAGPQEWEQLALCLEQICSGCDGSCALWGRSAWAQPGEERKLYVDAWHYLNS